jgi:uncharacterized protein (TIGR02145 family)/uncharacterized repeat protein (TIGR02543 family)
VDVNKYVTAATVTIKDNKGLLVKTGTSFAGWNTAADGIGTAHVSGATFPMSSVNVTLYAKWTTNPTFTVTCNGNANSSGTVPADANKYETAATVTVKDNTGLLVKTGSTFTGWNTAADGSGIPYAAAATFPMGSANVTLYAQWTLKPTFSVTYNGNGNSGVDVPSDTTKYETSATVTVKNNTGSLVRTGFTFTGWNTAADGSGTARAAGATFPMGNANVTLYAIWKKNECTITFDGQGATTAPLPASKTVNAGSAAGVLPVPGKTSYIFKGWWTGLNGTGTLLIETTPVELNVTVYAYWIIQDIDGNTYTEIRIGTQVWMVENLKTTRFNDGAMIKNVINAGDWNFPDTSAYCWYENNTLNKQRYGALYNFSAVVNPRKLAPAGWHVPTDGEVQTLFNYLIDNGFNYDGTRTGNMFAKALASKQNWNVSDVTGSPGKDLSTNNKSLFSAEPGGYRGYDGFYGDLEISTFFWTSSEMMNFSIHNDDPQTYMDPSYRGLGHSVRCLRDW